MARRPRRAKKQPPPPDELVSKLRMVGGVGRCCSILGIDAADTSGWGLLVGGRRVDSGTVVSALLRGKVLRFAINHAEASGLPLVVVMEDWNAGGWASAKTMFGMGAARGRWLEQLELLEFPMRRVILTSTSTWRSAALGKGHRISKADVPSQSKRRALLKQQAVTAAQRLFTMPGPPETDEAEALCIAFWATQADETIRALRPELREIVVKSFIPRVYTGGRAS